MFNLKSAKSVRLGRLLSLILFLGISNFGPVVSGEKLSSASAVIANPAADCSAGITCTITFNYSTTDYYQWNLPAGITSVTFDVRGSQGGGSGGYGGKVTGTLNVTGISAFYIYVGSTSGYNGGGAKATGLAGTGQNGGGASDIRTSASGTSYTNRVVVAGGGGGAGANCLGSSTSGAGGGLTGANGCSTRGTAYGGTQSSGGAGGNNATAGALGVGGNGGYCGGSGGGGGGYYGGGGGGSDYPGYCDNDDANGAGGSSYTNPSLVTGVTHTQGVVTGNGSVSITYPNGPAVSSSAGLTVTGTAGVTLYDTITAVGGSGSLTLSMDSAKSGVSFNPTTGLVTINILSATSFTQNFTATDSSSPAKSNNITVTFNINAPPSASQSSSTITTTVGRSAAETLTVTGGTTLASGGTANLTFTRQSSNAQTGITLDTALASSGRAVLRVAATGVAVGTYFETVTARDNRGATTVSVFTVIVNAVPTLSGSRTVANGTLSTTLGIATSETVTVVGGTGNKTFTLTQGSTSSAGITLDTTNANSGFVVLRVASNVAANTYLETITATDTRGSSVTYFFRVTVNPVITIGSSTTSSFATPSGTAATNTLTVTGGTTPRTMTLTSSPTNAGITLTTGVSGQAILNISSTVAAATYLETITVTDAVGATAVHVVTLTVSGPIRMDASNATVINTSFGKSASTVIRTVSGNTNKVFTRVTVSPSSSAGITLDTSTAASGFVTLNVSGSTPIGTYVESITVVDSSNSRAVATITVNVNPAPVLTFESSTAGSNFSSMSFNGTGAHVTLPANSNWQLGSDYTIEWWQYQTGNNLYSRVFSFGSSGLAVSIEGSTFYFWNSGARVMNSSSLVNFKNQWVHFAIVSRNNSVIVYQNGVALRAAQTLPTVNATQIPLSSQLCIAIKCGTTNTGEMYGGLITNFTMDKSARYTGISTTVANFRPSKFVTVTSTTLVALTSVNSEAKMTDSSSYSRIATNVNSPTGNASHPSASAASVSVITTQGLATRSAPFTASSGTGTKTFTLAPTISGITLDTSIVNSAVIVLDPSLAATNTTTAATYVESVTATDSLNSSTAFNVVITVNPRIILTAATPSITTSFGAAAVDTITATANTGTGAITFSLESNPFSSGITLVANGARSTVLTVARTVPQGIYYETITATDSLGSRTSIPITVTVNPGITLVGAGGVSTINTSVGKIASLQVNALNGASGKIFTKVSASSPTSAGITLDTTNAASGYTVVRVAANVLANTYRETITVTDSAGGVARLLVTIIVNAAPTLTGPTTVAVTAGRAGSTTVFTTSGGTGNKTFSLSPIVSGITIETATATTAFVRLASTLTSVSSTQPRTISETVTATDETGATANILLTITVNPAVIETATASSITMTSGVVRTSTIFASQGTGNKTFTRTSSTSSPGITMTTLVTNQALLTVAASVSPGQYFETITARDSLGAETSTVISILVNAPPTVTGPPSLVTTFGVGFTSPIYQATGGDGTYSFTLVSNPVSAGITVTSPINGVARINVGGSVAAGTYNETLTVTDSSGATGRYNFTIRVNAPVALSGTQTINTTYGEAFTTGFNSSGGTGPFTFAASNICAVSRSTFVGNGSNGTVNGASYTVDRILGVGTCDWAVPLGVESATALIVGGGGAGGTVTVGSSGGGGGGQILETQVLVGSVATVQVLVGAGGTPTPITSVTAGSSSGDGGSSSMTPSGGTAVSALGGGGGANSVRYDFTQGFGSTLGWTGGGGSAHAATASSGSTGLGGASRKGGNAYPDGSIADPQAGGGGGGAGGAGANAVSGAAGAGGSGVASFITGSSVTYGGGGGGGKRTASGSAGTATGGGGAGGKNGAGSAGSPNFGGGGGGSGENSSEPRGNLGGAGGSGTVVFRYLTPTVEADNSRISYLVSSAGTSSAAGLLTLSVPESVSAGSYSHTVIVRDSLGAASSPVTININVAKANPIVAISLPGGATSTSYGFGAQLTAQATTAGTVNFRENGTTISGCGSKTTTSLVATCRWVPATTGVRTITTVFTPTDTNNFNTGVISTFLVTVTQAETLTVTARSETFAFTDTTTAVTRGFTLTGLAEIDSATAVTMTYVGTPNDTSAGLYSSTTAPRLAGDNYEIRPTSLVFAIGSSSNYRAITYVAGTLSIARAAQVADFSYRNSNVLTYVPNGIETLSATSRGEALRTFTGSTLDKCSIESATGTLSIIEAGNCSVTMEIPQGFNNLSTSVTKNVTIAKAPRTVSLIASTPTIKYGDTATVITMISAGALDGVVSFTASTPTSCTFDEVSGEVTATAGSGTCGITARIAEGINYLADTSTVLTITAAQADGLIVTADTMTAAAYTGSSIVLTPTFKVTGLKFNDVASSSLTFTYSNLNYSSYSSTTAPTLGGLYQIIPSSLSLTTGSLSNYSQTIYIASEWQIEQIDQPDLVMPNLTGDLTFPVKLEASGGALTTPAIIFEAIEGTATNCRVVFGPIPGSAGQSVWSLQADSTGTCSAIATKPADRNYRVVISETATVSVLQFIQAVYVPEVAANQSTEIVIPPSAPPLTKGPDVCTTGCVPSIKSISVLEAVVADLIVITGLSFNGVTKVYFRLDTFSPVDDIEAPNFTVDSDTQISVLVPVGLIAGEFYTIRVAAPDKTSARFYDIEILP